MLCSLVTVEGEPKRVISLFQSSPYGGGYEIGAVFGRRTVCDAFS